MTHLADRREASGHLARRRERPNRTVVRLELTAAGRDLIDQVGEARRWELDALVKRLPAGAAKQVADAVDALVEAAGADAGYSGPIELQAL